jgi:hypothetical protein
MKEYRYTPSAVPASLDLKTDPQLLDWLRREFNAVYRGMIMNPRWDDLRAPAALINPVGSTGVPARDDDGSLLFDGAGTAPEQIAHIFQTSHSWDLTPVRPHIHWGKTTNAAGGVVWELRYRIINHNAPPPAWSAWVAAPGRSAVLGSNQNTIVDYWDPIDMTGSRRSDMLSVQMRRNPAATADTYGADARLWELDCHERRLGDGTLDEYGPT